MVTAEETWWSDDQILIIPGLPDGLSAPENERYVYPATTLGLIKALRSDGTPIELAVDRKTAVFVSHNSAEIWLPILQFGLAMLAGAGGNLISSTVERAFRRTDQDVRAHIDWRVKDKQGTVHHFKFVGPPKAAVRAAKLFESGLKGEQNEDE